MARARSMQFVEYNLPEGGSSNRLLTALHACIPCTPPGRLAPDLNNRGLTGLPRASAGLSERIFRAHDASESMETFYYNPTTRPSSIGARAEVLVAGGSLAVEVILEALLLHASTSWNYPPI